MRFSTWAVLTMGASLAVPGALAAGAPDERAVQAVMTKLLPGGFQASGGGATWCANHNRRVKLGKVFITQRGRPDGPWWPIRVKLTGDCITQDEFAGMRRPSYVQPFVPEAQSFESLVTLTIGQNSFGEWEGHLLDVARPTLGPLRRCNSPC